MDFNIKELIEQVTNTAQPVGSALDLSGTEVLIGPAIGGGYEVTSLEKFRDELRPAPKRRKGTAIVNTLAGFVDLVNYHKDESSAIFGSFESSPGLTAVIDYHTTNKEPRFGSHRVRYPFPFSQQWQAWIKADNTVVGQSDWGAFLEDRVADLASPTEGEKGEFERLFQTTFANPAEMMQLSRGLALTVEANVKDFRILQTGEAEISYEEVHKDSRGEKLRVPGLFVVNIPIFVNAEPRRLIARLRYRKKEGRIVWFYSLYQAREIVRETMTEAMNKAGAATGLPAYEGTPEA